MLQSVTNTSTPSADYYELLYYTYCLLFARFLSQSIDISIEYLLYLTTYVLYNVLCYWYYAIANIGYRSRVDRIIALLLVI